MLISIHGSDLRKVAWIDNDKPHTLNYFDDVWTRYLETGSSIFEFTLYKKAVKSDLGDNRAYNLLNDKAFVSFKYKGRSYVFSVMQIDEDETTMHCVCENLNLELINEYSNPYKASKAMTFSEYCKAMDLLNFSLLQIGRNEVEEKKLSLEWEGSETKLARLLSLAVRFDAELEFETRLRYDSTIKSFLVHVYKSYDGVTNNGVGQIRSDVSLVYGKNLRKMTRKIDKTGIFNAVRATGKRENDEIVTIAGASEIEVKNSKGQVEFYQRGEMLYAPLSMQRYPSAFTSETTNDQWIRKDMTVESDNPTVIRSAALASLRKNAYPAITYELDGWVDADIGDTVKITDNGFTPTLIVQARVFEQSISFTKPSRNKTVFANAKALENQLSDDAQGAIKRMIEELQPYSIRLATTNGVMFKNGQGTSTVIPSLYRGIKQITGATWLYLVNGEGTQTGAEYVVNASSIGSRMVLTVCAYIGNTEVFRDNLTFTDVSDGAQGADGKTSYHHWAYSDNADGTGLTLTDNGQRYMGYYTDYTQADSTDKTKYSWADRWAKIDSGGRNYFKDSRSRTYTINSNTYQDYRTFIYDEFWKNNKRFIKSMVRISLDVAFSPALPNDISTSVHFSASLWHGASITFKGGTTERQHFDIVCDLSGESSSYKTDNVFIRFTNSFPLNTIVSIENANLYISTAREDYKPAVEELEDALNSKADQALTDHQLNLLIEKAQLMETELRARAAMETLGTLETAYNAYVVANDAAVAKSEADIIEAGRRVDEIVETLGGLAKTKTFIDTYIKEANEGLIIGTNDEVSQIRVTHDRIAMYSAGKEVMSISQGVINIDNGVFTKSLQIGRFRTEQHPTNLDINVCRYLG